MEFDLEELQQLMRALREHDFHECEIVRGERRLTLRRGGALSQAPVPAAVLPAAAPTAAVPVTASAASAPVAESDPNLSYITSPFVGTFYRSPSPGADAFVQPGQRVEVGQVICIIEAMKLMNELEADVAGEVAEILVEDGKPVEYGEKLFRVRKSS
ncbi:MAG: acetyl-CoA carboxylase biotin carboxyl carrier protein [Polyangiales bacterium]